MEIGAKWKATIEYADFRILFLLLSLDYHSIQVFDFREIIICHFFDHFTKIVNLFTFDSISLIFNNS